MVSFLVLFLWVAMCSQVASSDKESLVVGADGYFMTQHEAEMSALALFKESGGGEIITSYKFDNLIYRQYARPGFGLSGFFLCGEVKYASPGGPTYGPMRVMFYFLANKIPALIVYDHPATGGHAASSLCEELQH
jgi:hypothetical protein